MGDTKTSALPAITTPAATDELPVNQGGVSKKATLAQVLGAGVVVGTPRIPTQSLVVLDGWGWDVRDRLTLAGTVRATVQGTGRVYLNDDFAARGRIVLAGRGAA